MDEEPFDLLLVAAHAPDLHGLRRHLGDALRGRIGGMAVAARAVGVGLVAAGVGTMRRILQTRPRGVVLLGTCGVYPGEPDWQPCDVVVPDVMRAVDHAVLAGKSAHPEPMSTELRAHELLSAGLAAARPRIRRVAAASPLAWTVDDAFAAAVPRATGCRAESLEAFAVASACQLVNVPFAAVLGATHVAGSRGSEDRRRFGRDAATVASEVVTDWLHAGAQGLPHSRPC
ncbi:MAG: hypothetical protein ACOC97_02415 [Myxococcota bacterium]